MQRSPDGEWFWDGTQWRAAYSPDRRWQWDGRSWVPTGPQLVQQWRYEPTEWTRRLQAIMIAVMALGVVVAIVAYPTILLPTIQQSIDRSIAIQSANSNVDPEQLRSVMSSAMNTTVGFGFVLGAAWAAVLVIGTVRLWRWVYWVFVVSFLFALISIPQNLADAFGLSLGTVAPPAWWAGLGVVLALAEGALGIWMIVLYRRFGTWARRRVPA